MRCSCSRREAGLIEDRRKLYQSCKRLRRLNRVRIWGQCWRYVSVIFSSAAGIGFEGIRTGSSCQLDPGAEVCGVVGEEPGLADFLCFLAAGASTFLAAGRFLLVAWALKGARMWKVSPHVLQVNVRSAACLSCAFRWRVRSSFFLNCFSQRVHSYSFSPVWIRWWVIRWLGRVKVFPQVSQRCSLQGFLAGGGWPSPDWISYNK